MHFKPSVFIFIAVEKNSVVDTTTDAAFDDTMDRQSAYSQPIGGTQSVGPVGNNNSSKTSETIAASTLTNAAIQPTVGIQAAVRVHLRSTSNAHIDSISNNSNSGSTAAVSPRPASAPVRDKATTTASLFDAQELKHGRAMFLSSIYQQLLASLVAVREFCLLCNKRILHILSTHCRKDVL